MAERLAAQGIRTIEDLLLHVPSGYEDRRALTSIPSAAIGDHVVVRGKIRRVGVRFMGRRRRVLEVVLEEGPAALTLRWFRFNKGMTERFRVGEFVTAAGSVTAWRGAPQLVHPEISDEEPKGEIVVRYPDIDGIGAKRLRQMIRAAAEGWVDTVQDALPPEIRERANVMALPEALRQAHLPKNLDANASARKRLAFDELFSFHLRIAAHRARVREQIGRMHAGDLDSVAGWLPFRLTDAQHRALHEIGADLASVRPMNRLLHGDVGSGKTAVAFAAAIVAARAGSQVALLAPTEVLAEQHAERGAVVFDRAGVQHRLLTGSVSEHDRRGVLEALAGDWSGVVVGTHALLEPCVRFSKLGLCVIDEQHRFGVEQRATLVDKAGAIRPDLLVMSATPIPRTLQWTLYGDLDVSVIDERPPGRGAVATCAVERDDEAWDIVQSALQSGEQAFVVYPRIGGDDPDDARAVTTAVARLRARLAPFVVEAVHGRLRADERRDRIEAFARGEIHALVATSIVEVGVDIAGAGLMVIAGIDAFGLSQLHQMRGRVGRSDRPGRCVLITQDASATARARVSTLLTTDDGFEIAEHDLTQRGPGALLGLAQHGWNPWIVADPVRDGRLATRAREIARSLLVDDPELVGFELLRRRYLLAGSNPADVAQID